MLYCDTGEILCTIIIKIWDIELFKMVEVCLGTSGNHKPFDGDTE